MRANRDLALGGAEHCASNTNGGVGGAGFEQEAGRINLQQLDTQGLSGNKTCREGPTKLLARMVLGRYCKDPGANNRLSNFRNI